MVEPPKQSKTMFVERSTRVSPIQQFLFGSIDLGLGSEPGVRLHFDREKGSNPHLVDATLSIPQLVGLVEVAAPDIPLDLRLRLIQVLAGSDYFEPDRLVKADAKRWVRE